VDERSSILNSVHQTGSFGVLDIETQRSAQEVGGWHRADRMRVSCVVLFDSRTDDYYEFVEGQVPALLEHIQQLDRVVGFNIKRFDYRVLSAYTRYWTSARSQPWTF
jgi:DEAD/DEAH box helicase domain-containing protein